MKNKLKYLIMILICIFLSMYVGYIERYNAIKCKVLSSENGIVTILHPHGEIYKFEGNVEKPEVIIIFDTKGTVTNINDDTIFKVK